MIRHVNATRLASCNGCAHYNISLSCYLSVISMHILQVFILITCARVNNFDTIGRLGHQVSFDPIFAVGTPFFRPMGFIGSVYAKFFNLTMIRYVYLYIKYYIEAEWQCLLAFS